MRAYGAFLAAWLFLSSLSGVSQPALRTAPDETFSENRKFAVQIDSSQINKPFVSVFARDGDVSRRVWGRPLTGDEETDQSGMLAQMVAQSRKLVSNDGSVVILEPQFSPNGALFLLLTQKGADKTFTGDDLLFALANLPEEGDVDFQSFRPGFALELFLDSEQPPIYAFWVAPVEQWVVLDFEKQELRTPDAALRKHLDELGLTKARQLAEKDQPGPLNRMLNTVKEKASEMFPAFGQGASRPDLWSQQATYSAYRFLAHQKNPEDKKYIERLLTADFESSTGFYGNGGFRPNHYSLMSSHRALGDELMSKWEGKSPVEETFQSCPWLSADAARHYFGAVAGTVRLPFETPNNAGALWIYLMPASLPEDAWRKEPRDPSVLRVCADFASPRFARFGPGAQADFEPVDHIRFSFATLAPGDYRLKALWDKRPPLAARNPEAVALAGPGDYESTLSKPFHLDAGSRIDDLQLECTNRVGAAQELFAEDERWKVNHPATYEDSEDDFVPRASSRQKVLFTAPISDWVIRTNENDGLHLNRIRWIETVRGGSKHATRALAIRFAGPPLKERNQSRVYDVHLEDEHGCRFRSGTGSFGRRTAEAFFDIVPYGAKQMKLVIAEEDSGNPREAREKRIGGTFMLKNLIVRKPEEWNAEALPAKRDLGLVTAELSDFNPAARELSLDSMRGYPGGPGFGGRDFPNGFRAPENTFTFSRKGEPVAGWRKLSAHFVDRWGNEASSISEFCKAEKVFKMVVQFAREPDKTNFLPDEIWEVPIPKVPGAGESVPLNLTHELQGLKIQLFALSGTGEFRYKRGRLLTATNQISGSQDRFAARFFPDRGAVQPKLFLLNEGGPGMMALYTFDYQRRSTVRIGSRIPHLSCRIPSGRGETLFALVQEDTSVLDPMNSRPQYGPASFGPGPAFASALKFLPLDFRPGETDKKLTFIVQKPRLAEFFVRVPPNARASPQE